MPRPRTRTASAACLITLLIQLLAPLLTIAACAQACPDPIQSVARGFVRDFNSDGTRLVVWKGNHMFPVSEDSLLVYGINDQGELNIRSAEHVLGTFSAMYVSPDVVVFRGAATQGFGYPVFRFISNDRLQEIGNVPSEAGVMPSIAIVQDLLFTTNLSSIAVTRLTSAGIPIPLGVIPHGTPGFSGRQPESQLVVLSNDTVFVYDVLPSQMPMLSQLYSPGFPVTAAIPHQDDLFLVMPSGGILRCTTSADSLVMEADAAWPSPEPPNLHFSGATDSLLFFTSVRGTVALDIADRDHLRWCGPLPWDQFCVDAVHNTSISMDDRLDMDSLLVSGLACRLPDLELRGDVENHALPLGLNPSQVVLSGSTCPYHDDFMDCERCECDTDTWFWPDGSYCVTREWRTGGKDVFFQFSVTEDGTLELQPDANYSIDLALGGPLGVLTCGAGSPSIHLIPGSYTLIVDGTFGDETCYDRFGGVQWVETTHDSSGSYEITLNWTPDMAVTLPAALAELRLGEAAPNPFNPSTRLVLSLAHPGDASLELFNAAGQRVRVLQRGALVAGEHLLNWDGLTEEGAPASSGLYLAVARGEGRTVTRKLLLLR